MFHVNSRNTSLVTSHIIISSSTSGMSSSHILCIRDDTYNRKKRPIDSTIPTSTRCCQRTVNVSEHSYIILSILMMPKMQQSLWMDVTLCMMRMTGIPREGASEATVTNCTWSLLHMPSAICCNTHHLISNSESGAAGSSRRVRLIDTLPWNLMTHVRDAKEKQHFYIGAAWNGKKATRGKTFDRMTLDWGSCSDSTSISPCRSSAVMTLDT